MLDDKYTFYLNSASIAIDQSLERTDAIKAPVQFTIHSARARYRAFSEPQRSIMRSARAERHGDQLPRIFFN